MDVFSHDCSWSCSPLALAIERAEAEVSNEANLESNQKRRASIEADMVRRVELTAATAEAVQRAREEEAKAQAAAPAKGAREDTRLSTVESMVSAFQMRQAEVEKAAVVSQATEQAEAAKTSKGEGVEARAGAEMEQVREAGRKASTAAQTDEDAAQAVEHQARRMAVEKAAAAEVAEQQSAAEEHAEEARRKAAAEEARRKMTADAQEASAAFRAGREAQSASKAQAASEPEIVVEAGAACAACAPVAAALAAPSAAAQSKATASSERSLITGALACTAGHSAAGHAAAAAAGHSSAAPGPSTASKMSSQRLQRSKRRSSLLGHTLGFLSLNTTFGLSSAAAIPSRASARTLLMGAVTDAVITDAEPEETYHPYTPAVASVVPDTQARERIEWVEREKVERDMRAAAQVDLDRFNLMLRRAAERPGSGTALARAAPISEAEWLALREWSESLGVQDGIGGLTTLDPDGYEEFYCESFAMWRDTDEYAQMAKEERALRRRQALQLGRQLRAAEAVGQSPHSHPVSTA